MASINIYHFSPGCLWQFVDIHGCSKRGHGANRSVCPRSPTSIQVAVSAEVTLRLSLANHTTSRMVLVCAKSIEQRHTRHIFRRERAVVGDLTHPFEAHGD